MDRTNLDQTLEVIDAWLQSKHTTLWLDWDITDPKQRGAAAIYVYQMIGELTTFASDYLNEARANDPGRVGG